jgi:hypothetical protein
MSTIPPNWLGSIIQTHGAQERAGQAKDAENADQAKRTGSGAFSEKLQDIIENTDRDVEVYADAEGAGSQGRPFNETEEEAQKEEEEEQQEDDADRLDIEA